jgi:hypothetical protein
MRIPVLYLLLFASSSDDINVLAQLSPFPSARTLASRSHSILEAASRKPQEVYS